MTDAKADLFAIMDAVPDGYNHLRTAILEGRIDGSYPNVSPCMKRGCLKAHLAEFMGCDSSELPGAARFHWTGFWEGKKMDITPAEKFIAGVRFMEKPEQNAELKAVLEWLDEWKAARDGSNEEDF